MRMNILFLNRRLIAACFFDENGRSTGIGILEEERLSV